MLHAHRRPLLAASLFLLAGCSTPAAPRFDPPGAVYVDRDTPRTVDLAAWVSGAGRVSIEDTADLDVTADGLDLTLAPRAGFTGVVELPIRLHGRAKATDGTLRVRVKDGTRRCETVFRYRGPGNQVHVAGAFNGFSATATPLQQVGGIGTDLWEAAVAISAGDWAYKLVVDGNWILDPDNPLTMYEGGIENSRVIAEDCAQPRLDLFDVAVVGSSGRFTADVAFVSADDGALPAGPPQVSLDGTTVNGTWDPEMRVLSIAAEGIAAGKHRLGVTASDASGRIPAALEVPFWIDGDEEFDWRDGVAYFVFTDRFRNGDPSNDAPVAGVQTPANYQGGDWQGLTQAIEEGYFEDLGVNVLWLSPHVDNPDGAFDGADARQYTGYHGYWPSDSRAAEERFGGMAALQDAIDAAHARGMRVILDAVLNHVHEQHAWWTATPGAPWFHTEYVCGWEQPIECWFAPYLPDLDFQYLPALEAVIDDAEWWVEQTGADGFRVDAVKHFEHVVTRTLRDRARRRFEAGGSEFWMVGETFVGRWDDPGQASTIRDYVSDTELSGQFDFPLYWEILRTIGRGEGTLRDLEKVLRESQGYYGEQAIMGTFLGNHDVARFVSHANGDIGDLYGSAAKEQGWTAPPGQPGSDVPYARLRSAFTLLLSLPGVPTLYYGDEIGLAGAGDPDNRRAMPWTALAAEQVATRAHFSAVAKARRSRRELSRGTVEQVLVENELLVLERAFEGRHAYVALNRGTTPRSVAPEVSAAEGATFREVLTGAEARVEEGVLAIDVPAGGSALYVLDP